jgi:hypothetical protein
VSVYTYLDGLRGEVAELMLMEIKGDGKRVEMFAMSVEIFARTD